MTAVGIGMHTCPWRPAPAGGTEPELLPYTTLASSNPPSHAAYPMLAVQSRKGQAGLVQGHAVVGARQ